MLAGHQPELFHPGVWVKNFALNGLARRHGLTPINLVVDNDTRQDDRTAPARSRCRGIGPRRTPFRCRSTAGRAKLPGRTQRRRSGPVRRLRGSGRSMLRGWDYGRCCRRSGRGPARGRERNALLGDCFAAARRTCERRWGCHNLEVPVSVLCRTEPFAWFACHLLAELPRFHAALQRAASATTAADTAFAAATIRCRTSRREDDWLEAPFWGLARRHGAARPTLRPDAIGPYRTACRRRNVAAPLSARDRRGRGLAGAGSGRA